MSRYSAEDGEQREVDEERLLAQRNMQMVSTFPSLPVHGGGVGFLAFCLVSCSYYCR